jgi:hypothetical protein
LWLGGKAVSPFWHDAIRILAARLGVSEPFQTEPAPLNLTPRRRRGPQAERERVVKVTVTLPVSLLRDVESLALDLRLTRDEALAMAAAGFTNFVLRRRQARTAA